MGKWTREGNSPKEVKGRSIATLFDRVRVDVKIRYELTRRQSGNGGFDVPEISQISSSRYIPGQACPLSLPRLLSFLASFILSPTPAGRHLAFQTTHILFWGRFGSLQREGIRNISAGLGFKGGAAKQGGADAEWMVRMVRDEKRYGTRTDGCVATGDTT